MVSNRDGMYSLQKRQSRKAPPNVHNEMILPQEWTYWYCSANCREGHAFATTSLLRFWHAHNNDNLAVSAKAGERNQGWIRGIKQKMNSLVPTTDMENPCIKAIKSCIIWGQISILGFHMDRQLSCLARWWVLIDSKLRMSFKILCNNSAQIMPSLLSPCVVCFLCSSIPRALCAYLCEE